MSLTLDFDYQELGLFFTDRKDKVKFITVNDRAHIEDVLIIPDSGGYDCTRGMFMSRHGLPPNFPPQDQHYQWFQQYQLDYFIHKKVRIFAFGTGAIMLWDHLEGKAMIENGKIELVMPLPPKIDVETTDGEFTFRSEKFFGKSHFNFTNKNYREILEFVDGKRELSLPDDDMESAAVLVE